MTRRTEAQRKAFSEAYEAQMFFARMAELRGDHVAAKAHRDLAEVYRRETALYR